MPQSRTTATAQIVTGIAAATALLHFLASIIIPFVIAFVLTVLVNALVQFIQIRWAAAPAWVVSVIAGLVVIATASIGLFVMAQGTAQIVAEGPALLARLDGISVEIGRSLHVHEPLHIAAIVGTVSIADVAHFLLAGMQGLFSGLLLMVVYFGFMLAGRKRIAAKVERAAGSSSRATTIKMTTRRIAADIETYVWVQTITGLILHRISDCRHVRSWSQQRALLGGDFFPANLYPEYRSDGRFNCTEPVRIDPISNSLASDHGFRSHSGRGDDRWQFHLSAAASAYAEHRPSSDAVVAGLLELALGSTRCLSRGTHDLDVDDGLRSVPEYKVGGCNVVQ